MRLTRSSVIIGVIGVLLIVGAVVVRFVVLPSVSKLPSDLNTRQDYSGTYTGLNPAALSGSASAGDVLVSNAPTTASRAYETTSTEGDTAVVTETIKRSIGGQAQPTATTQYAVDRESFASTAAPSGAKDVTPSQGLIFTLPLNPSTTASYKLWDATTAAAYPLKYQKTTTVEGRTVYQYQSVAEGDVADPAALGLPTSLPKAQLAGLAPALANVVPAQLLAQLQAILARLPDTIPISYTSSNTSHVWADSSVGIPIKSDSNQEITARLDLGVGVPVAVPFATIKLSTTAASSQSLADDASSNASKLNLIGTITPLVAGILGLLLLVWALVLARRAAQRPGGTAPPAVPETTAPAPV